MCIGQAWTTQTSMGLEQPSGHERANHYVHAIETRTVDMLCTHYNYLLSTSASDKALGLCEKLLGLELMRIQDKNPVDHEKEWEETGYYSGPLDDL